VAAVKHPDLANAIDRMYEAAAFPELAGCLPGGDDLASPAVRLGVSQGTLRGALKAIFRKTGAKPQAELVGLLTRIDI
jgi:hypothetical protein